MSLFHEQVPAGLLGILLELALVPIILGNQAQDQGRENTKLCCLLNSEEFNTGSSYISDSSNGAGSPGSCGSQAFRSVLIPKS